MRLKFVLIDFVPVSGNQRKGEKSQGEKKQDEASDGQQVRSEAGSIGLEQYDKN